MPYALEQIQNHRQMKKLIYGTIAILLISFSLTSCKDEEPLPETPEFEDLDVPSDFSWSAVSNYSMTVDIKYNGEYSELYDATPLDLMDKNGNLIDRSTIYDGSVEFIFKVPSATTELRLYSPLVHQSLDISVNEKHVVFDMIKIPNKSGFVDSDGDGIANRFDDYPNDKSKAYRLSFPATANALYFGNATKNLSVYDPNFIDFEEGNRDFYMGYCWQFYSTSTNNNGISGYGASARTGQLSNMPECDVTKENGGGFTTTISGVQNNGDGTYTIELTIEHDGCGGPSCKELSHYSVEADPGTYSDVSVTVVSGGMTYGQIDMGPNLGSDPFDGFKIDGTSGIGGGDAGIFTVTYTIDNLQDQQTSAKAGPNSQLAAFTVADFESVLNCQPQPAHRLYSPWYEFSGDHLLDFVHQVKNYNSSNPRYLQVKLVDENMNETLILDIEYSNGNILNESIGFNATGIYRFEWHWSGQGGNTRAYIDDIEIVGTIATDYDSNNGSGVCSPASGNGGGGGDDPVPGDPHYNYPGTQYYYHMFEDLWPNTGDYDLNDMVLKSQLGWDKHADNSFNYIYVQTTIQAVGAGIHSGLGWELFKNNGDGTFEYLSDIATWFGASADPNVTNGGICFDDVRDWQNIPYSNTGGLGPDAAPETIEFQVHLPEGEVWSFEILPYLFRTNNPSHQVRTFGAPPTASADMSTFQTADDDSPTSWDGSVGTTFTYPLTGASAFYRTAANHPWAIEFIAADFKVARETVDILQAYPQFEEWAESGGTLNQNWYDNPDNAYTYTPSYQ